MNASNLIKICLFMYFNAPIIVSVIFCVMGVIKAIKRESESESKNFLRAGGTGLALIAIASLSLIGFPRFGVPMFDNIFYWSIRTTFVLLITYAVFDILNNKTNGILKVIGIIILIFSISIFRKMF